MKTKIFSVAALLFIVCGCARSTDTETTADTLESRSEQLTARLDEFIDKLSSTDLRPPGFTVVVVHQNDVVYAKAGGLRNKGTGNAMTLDTPVYIASTTKAHNGLLAAILDRQGVLPLDSSLADVWPQVTLPSPMVPERITAASLLSHSSGIRAGGLVYRSNTTGDITADEVPIHLSTYAQNLETGFVYSNLGPFVYSAMVESQTGLPWRDVIKSVVFDRLELGRTSARLEDFSPDDVAHCHTWRDSQWVPVPHKPTELLNAGGGIYSSANDVAGFLKVFVDPEMPQKDAELASAARRSWETEVDQDRERWGLQRTGYGLGWDIGHYGDIGFVSRSGGYWGCRSIALFVPEEAFGVVVMSVGDLAVNSFNSAIVRQAIDIWTDAQDRADSRIEEYAAIAAQEIARVANDNRPPAGEISLSPDEIAALSGKYVNTRLGTLEIKQAAGKLVVVSGVFIGDLLPVGGDQFRLAYRGPDYSDGFEVVRSEDGTIEGVMWDDDLYDPGSP